MEAINWEAVQAVSEALGLIVVVGSLIFVGFQIRQNAQATRAASMNNIMGSWFDMYMRVSENDKLAEVVWNGAQDPNRAGQVLFPARQQELAATGRHYGLQSQRVPQILSQDRSGH